SGDSGARPYSTGEKPALVRVGARAEWEQAVEVDRAAFPVAWRLGRHGLEESRDSTPWSTFLVAAGPTASPIAGFAVVGLSTATGYLQRLAVHPGHQGAGVGRALVRASLRWAHKRGARTMLLNTQPDNAVAARLYGQEGFTQMVERLAILRHE
ncbi:MAG: GNAT family N-acetyltransferase, partial [Acidimicrobiia bacterium]